MNQITSLRNAGFSQGEINQSLGLPATEPNMEPVRAELGRKFTQKPITGIEDAFKSGWDMSTLRLAAGRPEHLGVLTEHSNMAERIAYQIGTLTGDAPAMWLGSMLGGGAGIAATAETGPGMGVGALVGAMAGAFALPAGLRATLIDGYENGHFKDPGDFVDRSMKIMWETAKGYITGAATGVAGVGGKALLPAAAPGYVKFLAPTAAELAAMTTVGKVLEGHLPTYTDFADGAIILFGAKGAVHTTGRLYDIYKIGALKPDQVVVDANRDISVRQDVADENGGIPGSYREAVNLPRRRFLTAAGAGAATAIVPPEGFKLLSGLGPVAESAAGVVMKGIVDPAHALYHFPEISVELVKRGLMDFVTPDGEAIRDPIQIAKLLTEQKGWHINAGEFLPRDSTLTLDIEKYIKNELSRKGFIVEPRTTEGYTVESLYDVSPEVQKFAAAGGIKNSEQFREIMKRFAARRQQIWESLGNVKYDARYKKLNELLSKEFPELEKTGMLEDGFVDPSFNPEWKAEDQLSEKLFDGEADFRADEWARVTGFKPEGEGEGGEPPKGTQSLPAAGGDKSLPAPKPRQGDLLAGGGGKDGEPPKPPATLGGDEPPGRSPEDAEQAIKDKMVPHPERQETKLSWNRLYTEVKDRLHPINVVKQIMEQKLGRKFAPDRDPYVLMRLLAGNSGKFKQVIEINVYDTDTFKNLGPGFEARLEPVKGDLDNFQAYMLARRSIERLDRGLESAIDRETARLVVKKGGAQFKKTYDDMLEFQEITGRQYLVKNGILSERQFQKFLDSTKDYVPHHKAFEQMQTGKKDAFIWNEIADYDGTNIDIVRPLETILRNTYLYIALGERNRAGLALLEGVEKVNRFQGGDQMTSSILKEGISDIAIIKETIRRMGGEVPDIKEGHSLVLLEGSKGEPPLIEQVSNPRDLPAPLRQKGAPKEAVEYLKPLFEAMTLGEGDHISVFRNGQRITLKVAPEIGEVFRGLDAQELSMFWQMMSLPAQMLRAGVTMAPEYAARNIIVDQPMAGIMSTHGYIPYLSAIRSIVHVWSEDEVYQRWLKSGGANVALVSVDSRYIQSKFSQWAADNKWYRRVWNSVDLNYREKGLVKGTGATMGDAVYAAFAPLRIMSQMSDTLTRLGEMRLADQEGDKRSAIGAGMDTREVTQDFMRIGSKMRALNAIAAFGNAQLEGVDRTVRAFKDRPVATTAKVAGMIMLPTLLLWLANKDEQWYQDQPDYIRDNFWLFKAGDHIHKIRKPFEIGTIFGSGLERSLDMMFKDDDEAFKKFSKNVFNNLWPNVVPTIAMPVLEHMSNHSFFSDRALVGASQERLLPEYQYTPYTSETAKAIGNLIGFVPNLRKGKLEHMPPIVVDNYIRQWSGGLGAHIVGIVDTALIKTGVVPDPIKPTKTLEEMPVIKAFMARYPSANTRSIEDFYNHYDDANKTISTIRELAKRGDVASASRLYMANQDIVKIEGVHKSLTNMNQLVQRIMYIRDISPDEKRQMLETLYMQMTLVGKSGVEAVHSINKQLKYKETVQ